MVENDFRGFFWLHVDVKQGVQATSLLHSQHLEVPQATTLNSENTYQKCAGQSCVLNLEYPYLVQVAIFLILSEGILVNTYTYMDENRYFG